MFCTNQQPHQRDSAIPDPVWVGSKWLLAFQRVPVTSGTLLHFFAMLTPERPQKGSTQLLQNWSPVFSCSSLARLRLLILLFLLMSGDVHPNPGPIFLCSVCAGNVTWRGQVSAMLHLLPMGPFKVLKTFPLQIQSSWQLSLLELPPAVSLLVTL